MSHPCDRYFTKHGHYPRVQVLSGIQRITAEFAPGYVSISTSSPYQAKVYITRSAFRTLLKKMVPLAKTWARSPAADHDVPAAMREAYWQETQILKERREMKKAQPHVLPPDPQKQRKRFLAARARLSREEALDQNQE
jgi:hypothetical protein